MKRGRLLIRTIIRDIVSIVKNKKTGLIYLPEDNDFYSVGRFPVQVGVEVTLKHNLNSDNFIVNAYYSTEDDVVEVLVMFNPNTLEKNMYDLIGELNEVVTHELQHSIQNYNGELDDRDNEDLPPLEYYLLPEELDAQSKGFKRLSKLTKTPAEILIKKWFVKHLDIHNLTDEEQKIVTDSILENM
jgi:hypothetical protein